MNAINNFLSPYASTGALPQLNGGIPPTTEQAIAGLLQAVQTIPALTNANAGALSQISAPAFGGSQKESKEIRKAIKTLMTFLGGQANGNSAFPGGAGPVQASNGAQAGGGAGASGAQSGGGVSSASKDTSDKGEIQSYIAEAAKAYGADPKVLTEMARRESNFDTGAVNDWDSNAQKGTPSKGLMQFIEPTFKSMAPKAKAANPKAWEGIGEFDWNDWRQQALVAAWAVANGQGSHWAPYKAAGGK